MLNEFSDNELVADLVQESEKESINAVFQENEDKLTNNVLQENEVENKNSPEVSNNTSSESIEIDSETANTTNCLALTIQEDHKIVALKNVFIRSIRMSWKVVISTITLALIKLFS